MSNDDSQQSLIKWFNSHVNSEQDNRVDCDRLQGTIDGTRRIESQLRVFPWQSHLIACQRPGDWIPISQQVLSHYNKCWIQFALVHWVQWHMLKRITLNSRQPPCNYLTQILVSHDRTITTVNLLSLMHFLDSAKQNRLIQSDPCLFQSLEPNANQWLISSSDQLLGRFLPIALNPESLRPVRSKLKSVKYKLTYVEPLSELEVQSFAIERLSCDLCDGVRLAKLLQNLFPKQRLQLTKSLKYPATRTKEKVSNMKILLCHVKSVLEEYDPAWSQADFVERIANELALGYKQATIDLLEKLIVIENKMIVIDRYKPQEQLIIKLQHRIKAHLLRKHHQRYYQKLRSTTIWIQKTFRQKVLARKERIVFVKLRQITIRLQKNFRLRRNLIVVRKYVQDFLAKRQEAALEIQRIFRGYRVRKSMYAANPWLTTCVQMVYASKQPSIGSRLAKILGKLYPSINAGQFVKEIEHIHRYIYYSYEIRTTLIETKCDWLFEQIAEVMSQLNRSEQHKIYAFHVLAIIRFLTEDQLLVRIQGKKSCGKRHWYPAMIEALVHLSNSYFNYIPLVVQSVQLLNRLLPLECERKWSRNKLCQRLVEKIKDRYGAKAQQNQCRSESHEKPQPVGCSCDVIQLEFMRLVEHIESSLSGGGGGAGDMIE